MAKTDNQMALDRADITDLISRFGAHLDTMRIDDLAEVFTVDVVSQFPVGEALPGLERLQGHARRMLSQWARTQHVITNVITDVDGDSAQVRANLVATHVKEESEPDAHWDVGGFYDFTARRTADGWRFAKMTLNAIWTGGLPMPEFGLA
jgi:bifunctional hydroxylase/dehydrase